MELISEIIQLHSDMRDITLQAGVPEEVYDKFIIFLADVTENELKEKSNFLFYLRQREYHGVLEIWRLLSPEIWQTYLHMGHHELREQLLLKDRRKILKKVWLKWYQENQDLESTHEKKSVTKSKKIKTNSQSEHVRPET